MTLMRIYKIISAVILSIATLKHLFNKKLDYDKFIYTAFPTVTMWLIVMGVE